MLAAFSITPIGAGEDVGEPVAAAIRVIRESGLPNRTSASFTEIEGEWDEVFAVIKKATDAVLAVSNRCSIMVKADVRPGYDDMLTAKVATVERYLSD
ncbi:MTH1187 family thiamine-binding protein [Nocardia sp. NPDC052001]|uniref:MTH1187 family thiamine-binding protein n=1 Tax=Nocardia sp. NPDC052001 TaxID=3154853 RepID=UPI00342937FA